MADVRPATLYRMILPDHTCPSGVRAKEWLKKEGFDGDDQTLRSRQEVEAFRKKQGVITTPTIFIDEEWIGGRDNVERYLERA